MAIMSNSLRDWNSDAFGQTFKAEMEGFRKDVLPLERVIGKGNSVYDGDLEVVVNAVTDNEKFIQARVGIYFAEVVACCSCGETPPIDEAYCELDVTIDKSSAAAEFTLLPEYISN